jgi:hypothetical protein
MKAGFLGSCGQTEFEFLMDQSDQKRSGGPLLQKFMAMVSVSQQSLIPSGSESFEIAGRYRTSKLAYCLRQFLIS